MASYSMEKPMLLTWLVILSVFSILSIRSNAVPTDVKAEVHDLIRKTLLTDQTDDAFFVVNMDTIHRQITRWKYYLPRVHFQFAMKANPLPAILELIIASGGGFDCASMYEMADVLSRGHPPENIIFAHTVKTIPAIKFAQKYGVKKMVLDAESEIVKIAKHFPDATPLIRLKVSDIGATLPLGKKFGTPLHHVPKLLQLAKAHSLNMVGVAFHVGSNISDPDLFPQAFNWARQAFDMAEQLGMRFTHLDIGGGFPSAQRDPAVFEAEAAAINSAIDQYFPNTDPRFEHLQIYSEPGRYFVGEFPLVSRVIGTKTHEETDERKQMVFLNEGFHGVFHGIYVRYRIFVTIVDQLSNDYHNSGISFTNSTGDCRDGPGKA